jgi:hypothetical protein
MRPVKLPVLFVSVSLALCTAALAGTFQVGSGASHIGSARPFELSPSRQYDRTTPPGHSLPSLNVLSAAMDRSSMTTTRQSGLNMRHESMHSLTTSGAPS